jgi:hypothetical protein
VTQVDVRFGSKADVTLLNFNVRFTPKSGHRRVTVGCPLCATSGHRTAFLASPVSANRGSTTHFGHRSGKYVWASGVGGGQLPKRNCFAAAAGFALILLCCSCAGRPLQGVLVPNAQSADGTTRVPILVATTRNRLIADRTEPSLLSPHSLETGQSVAG